MALVPEQLKDKFTWWRPEVEPAQLPLWDEPNRVNGFQYNQPRDYVLHHMTRNGWANKTVGHPSVATGVFSRMSNTDAEQQELETTIP